MAKSKKSKTTKPYGVNPCSVCEEVTLTFGWQDFGGVRYCRECLKHTLAWFQMTEEQRTNVQAQFDALATNKRVVKLLEEASKLTDEDKKALSIWEANRRLLDSVLEESR